MSDVGNMQNDWEEKEFVGCLMPVSIERTKQIQANSYLKTGKYPIVDQGRNRITGWTNDENALLKDDLPLIVFGDHTRVFKYVDFPFALGADGTKLIKPNQDEFSTRFFYYYLLTLNIPERGYNRHYKLLKEQIVHYPSFSEQQKIAAVLLKIQQAIELQDSIIEKTRELKKSTLHHVFTYGLSGEKLKETEIGPIPESWFIGKIGDIGKIVTGTTPPTNYKEYYQGGNYQFIAPNDIGKTTRIYEADKKITEKGLEVSRLLPSKTVCFVCIGSTIGKVGITVEEKTTTNQQINSIVVDDNYDPYFVVYLLDYKSEYIASFASPSPVPILSKGKFEEIIIMLSHNAEEQKEIARVLMTIDEKIEIHIAKKSALQDLFKTMLKKLMTGEIRVKDLDIDVSEVST